MYIFKFTIVFQKTIQRSVTDKMSLGAQFQTNSKDKMSLNMSI